MFQIADEKAFEKYHFLELATVFKHSPTEWRCETKCGNYLRVRVFAGIIHMSMGETENELNDENIVLNIGGVSELSRQLDGDPFENFEINKSNILDKLISEFDFNKIKDFMGWTCDEEQIWDN